MVTRNAQARKTYTPPLLVMGFLPVEFKGSDVEAGTLAFESREQLRELRAKHNNTHVFHRDGTDIYCIPLTTDAPKVGEPKTLSIEDPRIANRLAGETLKKYFAEKGQPEIIGFPPLKLADKGRNLLHESVSRDHLPKLSGLFIHPKYELQARTLYPIGQPPICGITLDVSTIRAITLLAKTLVDQGVPITGRYVVSDEEGYTKLLGKISRVEGNTLYLEDSRDVTEVKADVCFLEPSSENMALILRSLLGDRYELVMSQLDKKVFELVGAQGKLKKLEEIRDELVGHGPFECAPGVTFSAKDFILPQQDSIIPSRRFNMPTFVFDPGGSKTYRWHDDGLNQFGPFDSEFFAKKEPRIAVITPREYQGEVEVFVRQLKDGIPNSQRFAKGFVRKYNLVNCQTDVIPFDVGTNVPVSYRETCLEALKTDYDLALVVIQEAFHELAGDGNPYLVTKAVLMSHGVPVQEVEIETIREASRQYTLNNIGLACYAKLGGIPFTIPAAPGLAHELVIGLGSAVLRESRLGEERRVVGITTIFSGDGQYLLSNASKEVDYEHYVEELLSTLKSCLEEIEKRYAWQKGDTVRLVFHVFKPLKNLEAITVKKFVEELTDFNVEFAFLNLRQRHPFNLFDKNQPGVQDWTAGGTIKGMLVPERNFGIRIGPRQMLLTLTGPRQLKTPTQGCPKPVLVSLHSESTFTDMNYLTHQVLKFTFISWRSFFPNTLPVTISYSQFIATLLGQLEDVTNWNPDLLRTKLRTSRWFL